jgi:cytochrome P450
MAKLDEDFDPFAAFHTAWGGGKVRDPYPRWAELRAKASVHEGTVEDLHGVDQPMNIETWFTPTAILSVFSHDEVAAGLKDPALSSKVYETTMGPVMGHSLVEMDEPEHHRYRGLIQQAFSRRTISQTVVDLAQPILDELLTAMEDRERVDLVKALTFPFPIKVIAKLMDLPEDELPQFHRWAAGLLAVVSDPEMGLAASESLRGFFAGLLEERRNEPGDDLISHLAETELDGHRLTDEEIFAFLRLLLPAGAETTYRMSGNLLVTLLGLPDQLDLLRGDRTLIPAAIEEGLRFEPPLTYLMRIAVAETSIADRPIPKGAVVDLCLGSAGHDEEAWESADTYDLCRPSRSNLAFGWGPHLCLGLHLARLELSLMLEALLHRFPHMRLDPDGDDPHITGLMWRNPTSVPVLLRG